MTPTEQDRVLREKLYRLLKTDPRADTYVIPHRVMDIFIDFITADRKRVALEARIDEINYLDDNFQADSQDWEREHPGYSTAMIPMEDYIRRRAELKAQQEANQ